MLFNIAQTKPALNFTPGQFIDQIPGYMVKFDKIEGEDGRDLEGVFIHKKASTFENQQSIVAERGKFVTPPNKNYLQLVLFNGYVFEDSYAGKAENIRLKQPDQAIKFDTLVSHFDVSEIINKAIEEEKITEDFRFQSFEELFKTIDNTKKDNVKLVTNISTEVMSQTSSVVSYMDKNKSKAPVKSQYKFDTIKKDKKLEMIFNAHSRLDNLKTTLDSKSQELNPSVKYFNKVVIYQQRMITYSFTCIIFFMIGASLGSIIRKGGMGVPVIIAIVIFIIFYVINVGFENVAWSGNMNPYLAAWLPNIILFPFGILMTYKALTDSQLFDSEKYKSFFKPVIQLFVKDKEHKRYQ